jgi:hypothetical protein
MKSKLLFIAILSSNFLCLAQSQIYYPKVEWLQKGPIGIHPVGNPKEPLYVFKVNSFEQPANTYFFGIQKFNDNGTINPFNDSNSLTLTDKEIQHLYHIEIKNFDKNHLAQNEFLLTPRITKDSSFTTKPILLKYNLLNKTIDTTTISWNFNYFAVYHGIKVDSFYYFIIEENRYSESLRKYYLVKTDTMLNVLVKYPFSSITPIGEGLFYWRKSIIISGYSSVYVSSLSRYIDYPTIFLYNPENLNVFGKRIYKTLNTVFKTIIYNLYSPSDSILLAFTGNEPNTNFILRLDSNLNLIDSVSSVQGTNMITTKQFQSPQIIQGITANIGDSIIQLYSYNINNNSTEYNNYNIGFDWVSVPYGIIRQENNILIHGNTYLKNKEGFEDGYRNFRIVLDTNGIPIESRQPPTYLIENQIIGKFTLNVFPNPTSGLINVVSDHLKKLNIEIYNVQGKLIITTEISSNLQLNLEQQPEGIYLIKFTDINGASTTRKVIKY